MPAPQPTSPEPRLLLVVGSDQGLTETGGKYRVEGSTNLYRLIEDDEPFHRLRVTPDSLTGGGSYDFSRYRCIANLITEPEGNAGVLGAVDRLVRDYPGIVVNRAEAVRQSARDAMARRLAGIGGLHVPKVVRLSGGDPDRATEVALAAGVRFPALLRLAGKHTGQFIGRFETLDAVRDALADDGDHFLTEFVDFRGSDGLYRKYRAFFIGPKIILRHMLVSDSWNVHAKDRTRFMAERPELLAEEERLLTAPELPFEPPVRATLQAIRKRIDLDFFGMDFALLADGRVLLFEANATMNFFPFSRDPEFAYVLACIPPARQALRELLGITAGQLAPAAPAWGFAPPVIASRTR